jgi:hypothetical protein
MKEDLSALLPFYVNRTLPPDENRAVEAALIADNAMRREFFEWLQFKQEMDGVRQTREAEADPGGFAAVKSRLKSRTTLYIPLRRASAHFLKVPAWVWQPAAVMIVVLQFAAIALLIVGVHADRTQTLRTLSGSGEAAAATFPAYNTIFLPQASEEEIRTLLLRYRAQFVEGPNRIGLYRIRFLSLTPEQAEAFKSERIVQFMEKGL